MMHIYYLQSAANHDSKFGSYRTNIWKLFQVKCGRYCNLFQYSANTVDHRSSTALYDGG